VDLNGVEIEGALEIELPASGFRMIETDGVGNLAVGSVTVTSDQPVAGVIVFGGSVGLAGVGSSRALRGFVAPIETNTEAGINTGVAMMNLEEEAVTVSLTLLNRDGEQLAVAQIVLPGMGHLSSFLDEADKIQWSQQVDFSDFEGVLRATATGKIAATVVQTRPGQFATMPVAAP
jgi:hypothetical protein